MTQQLSIKEQREQKRVTEILDAAQELFSEKGLRGVTVDEIAMRALAAKSTVYEYFDSKGAILNAVVARGLESMSEYVRKRLGRVSDPRERVVELLRAELRFIELQVKFFEMISIERIQFGEQSRRQIMPSYVEHVRVIREELEAAAAAGVVRGQVTDDAAYLVFSAVQTTAFRWIVEGRKGRLPDRADRLSDILLGGIGV